MLVKWKNRHKLYGLPYTIYTIYSLRAWHIRISQHNVIVKQYNYDCRCCWCDRRAFGGNMNWNIITIVNPPTLSFYSLCSMHQSMCQLDYHYHRHNHYYHYYYYYSITVDYIDWRVCLGLSSCQLYATRTIILCLSSQYDRYIYNIYINKVILLGTMKIVIIIRIIIIIGMFFLFSLNSYCHIALRSDDGWRWRIIE